MCSAEPPAAAHGGSQDRRVARPADRRTCPGKFGEARYVAEMLRNVTGQDGDSYGDNLGISEVYTRRGKVC